MLSEFTPKGVRFKNSSLGTILKVPQSPPSDSVVGPGFALSVSESMSPGPKVSVKLSEELGLTMLADTATESLAGPPLGSTWVAVSLTGRLLPVGRLNGSKPLDRGPAVVQDWRSINQQGRHGWRSETMGRRSRN